MASPLAQFANARLLIEVPGSRGGPETGYKRAPGQKVVTLLFLKQLGPESGSAYKQLTASSVASDYLSGYIVSYVAVPDGAEWQTLDVEATAGADHSGQRPAALHKGGKGTSLQFGNRLSTSVEVVEAAGQFDDLGIGAIVREIIGDRIVLAVEWRE
ncbi:hypothetical protein [Vulcanococcus sp.]|uniref:hypothetical protein n=1 Tax=Vulcanococcus sp. TaxID=2856995 RepID=UPI003C0FD397